MNINQINLKITFTSYQRTFKKKKTAVVVEKKSKNKFTEGSMKRPCNVQTIYFLP